MSRRFAALIVLFAAAFATPANALLCSALTGCSCTVSASPVQFNAINSFAGPATAEGLVSVDCTGVVDIAPRVSVKFNRGLWGSVDARAMHSGAGASLNYNIYTTAQHAVVVGDGTAGTIPIDVSGGLITLGHWRASQTVYGVASPLITTSPGAYSDTVIVRIDW